MVIELKCSGCMHGNHCNGTDHTGDGNPCTCQGCKAMTGTGSTKDQYDPDMDWHRDWRKTRSPLLPKGLE